MENGRTLLLMSLKTRKIPGVPWLRIWSKVKYFCLLYIIQCHELQFFKKEQNIETMKSIQFISLLKYEYKYILNEAIIFLLLL